MRFQDAVLLTVIKSGPKFAYMFRPGWRRRVMYVSKSGPIRECEAWVVSPDKVSTAHHTESAELSFTDVMANDWIVLSHEEMIATRGPPAASASAQDSS